MHEKTTAALELHTLRLAVAFLLAQESKRSPQGVDALHEAMAQHFITAVQTQGQDHPKEALALEVAMTNQVDGLMRLARSMV